MNESMKKEFRESLKALERAAKNKKPTEKFAVVHKALDLIKQLIDIEEGDAIDIEYEDIVAYIMITTNYLSFNQEKMDIWRKLMEITDLMEFTPFKDSTVEITLQYNNVFEL